MTCVQCPPPSSVAKNVVGDNRVRLRLENLEMSLFLKYRLRALSYNDMKNLEWAFYYSSILVDSENEDSDIDLNFIDGTSEEMFIKFNIECFDFNLQSCEISMVLLPFSQRNLRLILFISIKV